MGKWRYLGPTRSSDRTTVFFSPCDEPPKRSDFSRARSNEADPFCQQPADVAAAHHVAPVRATRTPRTLRASLRGSLNPDAPPGRKGPTTPHRPDADAPPALQKSTQHSAFGIVDSAFHGRARPRGNPWRVADHSAARPSGKRSACTTSMRSCNPNCRTFSRAHASARGSRSVATTRSMPRRARTAASTPVPVPISKATLVKVHTLGRGVVAMRSTYSQRIGAKTPK